MPHRRHIQTMIRQEMISCPILLRLPPITKIERNGLCVHSISPFFMLLLYYPTSPKECPMLYAAEFIGKGFRKFSRPLQVLHFNFHHIITQSPAFVVESQSLHRKRAAPDCIMTGIYPRSVMTFSRSIFLCLSE